MLTNLMNYFTPAVYRHKPVSIATYSMGELIYLSVCLSFSMFVSLSICFNMYFRLKNIVYLWFICLCGHFFIQIFFSGAFGGIRAQAALRPFLAELGMVS
jgi:hypothetical protein